MSLQLAAGAGPNMIPTPFLDAHNQLDKRKALNVIVLSTTVRTFNVSVTCLAPLPLPWAAAAACVPPGTFSGLRHYTAAGRAATTSLGTSSRHHTTPHVHETIFIGAISGSP